MCGRCEGTPYRGVNALFNSDLQRKGGFEDRQDWLIVSPNVIVHMGASALQNEDNLLFHGCDTAFDRLEKDERLELKALSEKLGRPVLSRVM